MKEPAMGRTLFEKTSTNTQKVKKKSHNLPETIRSWWENDKKQGQRTLGHRISGAGSCIVRMVTSPNFFLSKHFKGEEMT